MKIKVKGMVFPKRSTLRWSTEASEVISIITSRSVHWISLAQSDPSDTNDPIGMVVHDFSTHRATVWFNGRPLRTR